ncbi:MAG TPA: porin [Caulobacteraceae bacterium]|jgi:phosphate-selective porin OprO/OprP|nr:porin [Caulobacteraceae bacterium]
MAPFAGVRRGRLSSGAAAAATVLAFGPAARAVTVAQGAPGNANPAPAAIIADPREAQIEKLEAQVQALAAEVHELKAARDAEAMRISSPQKPDPPLQTLDSEVKVQSRSPPEVGLTNARPQITSSDGRFRFALRAIGQFDAADYGVRPRTASNDLASGTNIRRARLGFDATAFRDWNFSVWGEFGGSGNESAALSQAFVEYAGFDPFGWAEPIRLRAGAWATPAGLEDATANTEALFLERPAIEEMIRGLDAGDAREGVAIFATGARWYFSGVLTGKTAGGGAGVYDQQAGFLVRGAVNLLHGGDYDVHLGGSLQGVAKPADGAAGAASGYIVTLAQQPELRVDANNVKLVGAGPIVARREASLGAEGGASLRNLYVAGEYFRVDVDRTAVGSTASPFNPHFSGWYVQGAWTVTGERHVWNASNGGFRGIFQPAHPLAPGSGTWGAWEIAVRYSVLDLNDHAGAVGQPAPPGGLRGGVQRIVTIGLNWYPNPVVRLLLDYQHGDIQRLGASGAQLGEVLNDWSMRAQFAF